MKIIKTSAGREWVIGPGVLFLPLLFGFDVYTLVGLFRDIGKECQEPYSWATWWIAVIVLFGLQALAFKAGIDCYKLFKKAGAP